MTTIDMLIVDPVPTNSSVVKAVPIEKVQPKDTRRAVFGASKKSLTSESGIDAKAGNTVAKTPDKEQLNKDDVDVLPIPVDEYAVSEMPRLKSEYRIPYPAEAKKNAIQGAVVMDLLIDSDGVVREAKLLQGPGFGLNEAALEAVRKFEFLPARQGDNKVAVRIRYSYRFVLEK
jgi:protein TonB